MTGGLKRTPPELDVTVFPSFETWARRGEVGLELDCPRLLVEERPLGRTGDSYENE